MARRGASLDDLFDRPYRPGAAFGPRISPLRRWGMVFVLFLLIGVIVTYWYLTDSRRVRAMAQDYLSKLTGGHVEVKNATLSIFEGLRLDGVSVRVDDPENKRPDSLVFRAETFLIKYNPQSILSGRLEATQIVAMDPQVFLCEDLDRGRWNWQRTAPPPRTTTRKTEPQPMTFPEVLLRNAQINYTRIRDGRLLRDQGVMEIEGSLKPLDGGEFAFAVQSRGEADAIGPVVKGQFNVDTKVVQASLENFRFGKEIEVMLPEQVRAWWTAHGLSGTLNIPRFYVKPGRGEGERSRFRIETDLRNVTLDIQPEEWLSREETSRLTAMRHATTFMRDLGLDRRGFVTHVEGLFNPSMVELDKVAGQFVFTEDGIEINKVSGWVEKNPFTIDGRIHGYSAQSAATVTVRGENVTIPHAPRYVNSMPPAFRELYDHLRPEGDGALLVKIDRQAPGAKPLVSGRVDILDGKICFDEFPYPLRKIRGVVTFGWDEKSKMDRVDVAIRGLGVLDGPNKDVPVDVRGFVGPLGQGDSEFDFWVMTDGVTSEPALHNAYPAPVREALRIFDAAGRGEFPRYFGGFVANVHRPPGPKQKWAIKVDVKLDDAQGALTFFPYPVPHLTGRLHVTDERVDLIDVVAVKGDARLGVEGAVHFGKNKPIDPRVRLKARDIPIDADLIAALPKDRSEWLAKLGVGGKLDVDGTIERRAGVEAAAAAAGGARRPEDDIAYDLSLKLKEGTAWPAGGGRHAATGLTGSMRLTPTQFVVSELKGRRGEAALGGSGMVDWVGGKAKVVVTGTARGLRLDDGLYKLLPPAWQAGWDQARPDGTVDVDVSYTGGDGLPAPGEPTAAAAPIGATPAPATTRPAGAPAGQFEAVLRPVKLSMTPRVIPCRLDDVKGELRIRPDGITLTDVTATRKSGGTVAYSGTVPTGVDGRPGVWDLKLTATDVTVDKELKAAVPPAVAKLLETLGLQGKISVDFRKLTYRADPDPAVEDGSLDFAGTVTLGGNAFDLGVPVTDAVGTLALAGGARRGRLAGLTGAVDFSSMNLGARAITNFKCDLIKPEAEDGLRIGKISGTVAGGAVAGQVDLLFPDNGPSRFGVGLVLRNADVATLVGPTKDADKDIKGQLTASLAIEGNWGDAASRRGRGEVAVTGKEMYRVPLVLGLMQVTQLALPISSPFNEAAARYSVEGERVNVEQIELRASNMLMSGSGWIDFATKKVKMSFRTDNPNAWRIPFITELLQGARSEFLQIHVSGSVKEPKVSGSVMSTFTTTVDEVLNNDKNKANGGGGGGGGGARK
jgi:hypothetical protein